MKNIILIAEDYEDARAYMVIILKSYGFEVYEAENGKQALEIAKTYHPHLILMDISMPVMDGLEATRLIRESGGDISQVPIVAVTAFGDSYQSKALAAGCNEVVAKPIDFDEFDAVLNKYFAQS